MGLFRSYAQDVLSNMMDNINDDTQQESIPKYIVMSHHGTPVSILSSSWLAVKNRRLCLKEISRLSLAYHIQLSKT